MIAGSQVRDTFPWGIIDSKLLIAECLMRNCPSTQICMQLAAARGEGGASKDNIIFPRIYEQLICYWLGGAYVPETQTIKSCSEKNTEDFSSEHATCDLPIFFLLPFTHTPLSISN